MTEVADLLRELAGTRCRCGAHKHARNTFCRSCFHRLPPPLRRALYDKVGAGYEAAYAAAVGCLEAGR